ncbi:hypothetical protein [Kitasatospora sp. MAP5-34]|uniref:hypothetical protein n=1 Tax=Kitasatospora sp. MAP5-34 TaxID=3035102 RepID=UPI002475706E|nr:hypothetical protein [Kitasatospora sp. MAP5-34]MDH6576607.1 hypothetical protein [Kitasatospora sp. MAP5-34]
MKRTSASRPQDPEDFYADHEEYSRQVLSDADFPVYAVDRAEQGGGAHRADPAREAADTPPNELPSTGAVAGGEATGGEVAGDSDALAEYELQNGRLGWVEVRSGDWTSVEGPYVTVRTYRPGAERGAALPDLEDVVEDERDRVYEQLDIDEGDGPGSVRALREWITVEGEPRAVQIHEDCRSGEGAEPSRPVWAGRLRVDGITVTVTGRGVPPGGIELKKIQDFERYILGRTDLMRKLAAQQAHRAALEERELPPVVGLEAHRAVVEHAVREAVSIEAQVRARRTPRLPRRSRGAAGAVRWEAAVRQQMRLASETREEAGESVTAMVNHLTRLAQNTDWAAATPEGTAAMEEVIRYTAFASEVPSLPAQRAWERYWSGGAPRAASAAEEAWLTAWEQWRVERTQH